MPFAWGLTAASMESGPAAPGRPSVPGRGRSEAARSAPAAPGSRRLASTRDPSGRAPLRGLAPPRAGRVSRLPGRPHPVRERIGTLHSRAGAEANGPSAFGAACPVPEVECVQVHRARSVSVEARNTAWREADVIVTPPSAVDVPRATTPSERPDTTLPGGFRPAGTPLSVPCLGGLWRDAEALHASRAFRNATGCRRRRPLILLRGPTRLPRL